MVCKLAAYYYVAMEWRGVVAVGGRWPDASSFGASQLELVTFLVANRHAHQQLLLCFATGEIKLSAQRKGPPVANHYHEGRPKSRPKNRFIAVIHACMAMLKPFTGTASRFVAVSPRAEAPMSSAIHLAKLFISTLVTSCTMPPTELSSSTGQVKVLSDLHARPTARRRHR